MCIDRLRRHRAPFVALLALTASFAAGDVYFTGLGDLPGGGVASAAWAISRDGSVSTGVSLSRPSQGEDIGREAFLWRYGPGMVGIGGLPGRPETCGLAVADAGVAAVGWARLGNEPSRAFRWTPARGMADLGTLGASGPYECSQALAVSADGLIVYGSSTSANGVSEAFRWTSATGMVALGDLPGGDFNSVITATSADGHVGAGGGTGQKLEAVRWTAAGGMVGLGSLAGSGGWSYADAISADGSTIVGISQPAGAAEHGEAFRWTESDGMVSLGSFSQLVYEIRARAVSADGSTIVGSYLKDNTTAIVRPFIWDATHGLRDLQDVLVNEYGLLEVKDWSLGTAMGISGDGVTIVGYGGNPSHVAEGWLVRIPEPATVHLLVAMLLVTGVSARGVHSISNRNRERNRLL